ncbi:MAG: molybdopterin molybdotransferase MoeA [Nocardiopsaceae bacterium]|nr:molybdopterin molybdotransferase MoeA [Nocardiopsaceae bacterium]
MMSVEAYLDVIRDAIRPLAPSELELADAEGCVLAEDVTAAVSLPPFDNSGMDGYAVLASDVSSASASSPVTLPVTGEIAAGDVGTYRLVPGTAMRIMTGARLPAGADAVVPVEWTDADDARESGPAAREGGSRVSVRRPASAGNAVRYVGEDARAGDVLLTAGVRMRPMHIAVAASAGRRAVRVRPRPRIVVLSTGNELAEPGTPLVPGQIWESNSYMLAALAREAGAVACRRSVVPDEVDGVLPAISSQLGEADLVITTGGVSMGGEHDVVKAALASLGTVAFRKVAMQPGMPQGFGVIRGSGSAGASGAAGAVPIFTFPGNPVSAYVSFQLFARPALGFLQGLDDMRLPVASAVLTAPVRSPAGRRSYLRGVLSPGREAPSPGTGTPSPGTVEPLSGQGSHQVAALGRANCLIIVPEREAQLPAGHTVDVLVLP